MAVLAWLNGSDGRMVNQEWFGHDDRLKGYSVETAIGVIEDGEKSLKINTQHLRDVSFRVGSVYQFIGELHIEPNNEHFIYIERKGGLLEFIEKRIKLNGHMVIVLAEEHGKS
uniref:Uncharacterized protein n=1 Tax=Brassica campestris TaxID=3711 RepID=M4F793_BRACM